MIQDLFRSVSASDKSHAVEQLLEHSSPSADFFLMVILSVLMATFGLLTNSSSVIVGSMLIAPILFPILSLALGITLSDFALVSRSAITLAKAGMLGILISVCVTLLFTSHIDVLTPEILERTHPSLFSAMIGAVAGLAAAFAVAKPKVNETLPGIAISVALIPPLAVVGIGIARLNMELMLNAFLLFLINAVGVIFAATIVFSLMNFYRTRRKASAILKREEKHRQPSA